MTEKKSKELVINVDGASRGNPGPSSFGVVVCDLKGNVIKSLGQRIGNGTNNVAEYFGLIFGLQEAMMMGASEVIVRTDSELVTKQINGQYKIKDPLLVGLALIVKHLQKGFKQTKVVHVPREENQAADDLANKALDEFTLF